MFIHACVHTLTHTHTHTHTQRVMDDIKCISFLKAEDLPRISFLLLQIRNNSPEIGSAAPLRSSTIRAPCLHLRGGFLQPASFNALLSTSHFNLSPESSFPYAPFPLGSPSFPRAGSATSSAARAGGLTHSGLDTGQRVDTSSRRAWDRDRGFKAFPSSL